MVDEAVLAERLAYEREAAGMSYEGLASRMKQLGCPIAASALYKIEKGDPPRKMQAAELIALSKIFDVTVEEFTVPPELLEAGGSAERVRELWARIQDLEVVQHEAVHRVMLAWRDLEEYLAAYPGARQWLDRIKRERSTEPRNALREATIAEMEADQ